MVGRAKACSTGMLTDIFYTDVHLYKCIVTCQRLHIIKYDKANLVGSNNERLSCSVRMTPSESALQILDLGCQLCNHEE